MPEYPDITVYVEHIRTRLEGQRLSAVRLVSPFLLRTVEPSLAAFEGAGCCGCERLGKRIVLAFEDELYLAIHLMVAGRLHWRSAKASIPRTNGLAAFDFESGTLLLTESGTRKRASLHALRGRSSVSALYAGGVEPLACSLEQFVDRLNLENRTLKRALTDQRLISGIGNTYSDEILHRARLSPVQRTRQLSDTQMGRLYECTREVLTEWAERLRKEAGERFPERVTAFHKEMAVHGRYREPRPVCGSPVQRIRYAENETNYCPTCQTGGTLLADRALSRLLRGEWPRTLSELEEKTQKSAARGGGAAAESRETGRGIPVRRERPGVREV